MQNTCLLSQTICFKICEINILIFKTSVSKYNSHIIKFTILQYIITTVTAVNFRRLLSPQKESPSL